MQTFLQETLPSDTADLMLNYLKNTRKPLGMSSKKWMKKTKQCTTLRKFIDDEVRHVVDKEIIDEMILPTMPQQWHVDLVRLGGKSSSPMKKIVIALENFEDHERKFDLNPKTNQRRNQKHDNNRSDGWENKNKGKHMCRVP